jgi:hypothetical protein
MREHSIKAMQEVYKAWTEQRRYSYESKRLISGTPTVVGEEVFYFTNTVWINCGDQTINITRKSSPFHTGTLSDRPTSDNPNGDAIRLQKELERFDNAFYQAVDLAIAECDNQGGLANVFFE